MGKSSRLTQELIRGVMRVASDAREYRYNTDLQQQSILDGLNALVCGESPVCLSLTAFVPNAVPVVQRVFGSSADPVVSQWMQQIQSAPLLDPLMDATVGDLNHACAVSLHHCQRTRGKQNFDEFQAYRRQSKLKDRLHCRFRHSDDHREVTSFEVHRFKRAAPFDGRETATAKLLMDELWHLHERGHLQPSQDLINVLSPRQQQIMHRILAGNTPKGIARELGLSVHTVREHLQGIYRKFGVTGREELTARFVDHA